MGLQLEENREENRKTPGLIGANNPAPNNVLFNIVGTGFGSNSNLIHISNASGHNQCPGWNATNNTTAYNACDITIMGVTNLTNGSTTIYDQVGGATLTDSTLGMYILGEPVQYGSTSNNDTFLGNSHFTTSLNWPTWLVETGQATGTACPSVGSLYSVTSGAAPTLLECEHSGWAPVK